MNTIIVRTRTTLVHRYAAAPQAVAFLREYHRHELHIEVELEVTHADRELEFIMVKEHINQDMIPQLDLYKVEKSCEMIAQELAQLLERAYGRRKMKISVFEDGENGGVYYHDCEV
jgi:hypothetical protein